MPSGTSAISRVRTASSSFCRNWATTSASDNRSTSGSRRPTGTSHHCRIVDAAALEDEHVARQQPVDAFEQRFGAGEIARAQELGQRRLVGLGA